MFSEKFIQYFHYDPLVIFRQSRTPAALYARQKWMHEGETKQWRSDFAATVEDLLAGQSTIGSWQNDPLFTIHRLFGLHLTVRNRNEEIDRALSWLLSQDIVQKVEVDFSRSSEMMHASDLRNLPFSSGNYEHVILCATLFLASIFGYEYDERVINAYETLLRASKAFRGKWCTWSCSNNFLRACIVHPACRESDRLKSFVSELYNVQGNDGGWPMPIPFYQTVNALGHIDTEQSDAILQRAFCRLREIQNRDGTWGRTEKEWKTFLIVHAIKRKSSLL